MTALAQTEPAPGRPPFLVVAAAAAVVSAALMGLSHAGEVPLVLGVAVLQALLVLGVLAVVEAPSAAAVAVLGAVTAVVADVTVAVRDDGAAGLAGVTALGLVGSLLVQLLRRPRTRVTEALADSLTVVVLVTAAACLPAALQHEHGEAVLRTGLLAGGAALVVGRVADRYLRPLSLGPEASRGWPGLALALVVGAAVAVPEASSELTTRQSLLVGLVCAAAAALGDLFVDLAAAEVMVGRAPDRRLQALRPVTSLLPFALVGPVVLAALALLERS